jgi:hypothetical protein
MEVDQSAVSILPQAPPGKPSVPLARAELHAGLSAPSIEKRKTSGVVTETIEAEDQKGLDGLLATWREPIRRRATFSAGARRESRDGASIRESRQGFRRLPTT